MKCSACGHAHSKTAKFCAECGAQLGTRCPHCAVQIAVAANYCPECGGGLQSGSAPGRPAPGLPRNDEAELRHITVMFCDLIGSTELAQKVGAEDLLELVKAYHECCAGIISGLNGEIAQYLGDGILVYFGDPIAQEDDPARAITAGLAIVNALPDLNRVLGERFPAAGRVPLQVRVGVHTGPVVVGSIGGSGRSERLALGETVNTAARLLGVAEPGWVVISEATRRLVQGVFKLADLGLISLKGLAEPVGLSRVEVATGVPSLLANATRTGLTPLEGREQEIALLLDRWEQVNEDSGQVVLLSGEAGIGKSRLIHVLRNRLSQRPHSWFEARCSPLHRNSALRPVVDLVEQGLLFSADDSAAEKLTKLERGLSGIDFRVPEVTALFASMLSIQLPEDHPKLELRGEEQRHALLEALSTWLFALVELQPAVLVLEDLHWSDPSTLEFFGMLIEQAPTARLLLLLTFRPEFQVPWSNRSQLAQLPIHPLTRSQTASMVHSLAGDRKIPAETVAQLMTKTEGVPLFVEEFTKSMLEAQASASSGGAEGLELRDSPLEIPATLQASLMARIDHLGTAKEVAQLGAVIGREFSFELLEAVSTLEARELEERLDKLTEAELVYQRGVPPRALYQFKHALIQDVAYRSLLKRRRRSLHARIAPVLEKLFPELVASQPEIAARHYEEAKLFSQAADYYLKAGERFSQQSANDEAIGHLRRGIKLLASLPEGPERDHQELQLQLALGVPLQAAQGNADPEVEATYTRALKLAQGIDGTPQIFPALRGLFAVHQVRGELESAVKLGEQLLEVAKRTGRTSELLQAHLALGSPNFFRGRFSESLDHLQSAIDVYDPEEHRNLAYLYGLDQGVNSRAYAALALCALGHPDRALEASRAAIALARQVHHPYSLATALGWAAVLHQMRREPAETQAKASEAIDLSRRLGFPSFLGVGLCYRGWAVAESEDSGRGLEYFQAGLDELSQSSTSVGGPQVLGLLAQTNRCAGRDDEALANVEAALALSQSTGQPLYDAELNRIKGELLLKLRSPDDPEVEQLFRHALEVARGQQAKCYELRAAMSLGRLLQQRGETKKANELLSGVHGWFSEGFDTPDLKESKALLAEWS